jgi:hypothetical protein
MNISTRREKLFVSSGSGWLYFMRPNGRQFVRTVTRGRAFPDSRELLVRLGMTFIRFWPEKLIESFLFDNSPFREKLTGDSRI